MLAAALLAQAGDGNGDFPPLLCNVLWFATLVVLVIAVFDAAGVTKVGRSRYQMLLVFAVLLAVLIVFC